MSALDKPLLGIFLLTFVGVSWAACPEGQKQTYKGCEPDSEMAAAHEAVRKAHELLQAAKTPEEREELEAAAVAAIEKTAALHVALEAQKAREQLALQARARADNQKAHEQTVQLVEERQEARATISDAQETLSAAKTPEERAAAQELIAAAQSGVSVRDPNQLTAAQADLATAKLSVLVTGSGNLSKNKLAEVKSIVAAQEKLLLKVQLPTCSRIPMVKILNFTKQFRVVCRWVFRVYYVCSRWHIRNMVNSLGRRCLSQQYG